jgi:hypothetical protein
MFRFFKKKACPEAERIETSEQKAARKEFEQHVNKLRDGDELARASAGQGIKMANSFFMQTFSKVEKFVELSKVEQMAFIGKLAGMGEKLSKVDPQTALGITLFRMWLVAVAEGDGELMDHFADELVYFTSTAEPSTQG